MKGKINAKAFTLIEMTLTISLVLAIGLVLYHALVSGMQIWERNQRFRIEEDIAIFFDKFAVDLSNTQRYSLLPFQGKSDRMTFSTIVHTPMDAQVAGFVNAYTDQVGLVEYSFDKTRYALYRRQANYGQAMSQKFGPLRSMADPVRSVEFSYYLLTDGEVQAVFEIKEGEMPLAVEVKIEFVEDTGQIRKITQIIPVPVGV